MKRIVIAVMLVLSLSVGAFGGVILGLSGSPVPDQDFEFVMGYRGNEWSVVAAKSDFDTWKGEWSLGIFWESNGYRLGPKMTLDWDDTGLTYETFSLVVGSRWTAGAVGSAMSTTFFGQLEISTESEITPSVGMEMEFVTPQFLQMVGGEAEAKE